MTNPTTRAEARQLVDEVQAGEPSSTGFVVAELQSSPADFLPLGIRRGLYLLGLAALVIAPSVAVQFPEYGDAITTAGNLLGAAGLGTALANPTR